MQRRIVIAVEVLDSGVLQTQRRPEHLIRLERRHRRAVSDFGLLHGQHGSLKEVDQLSDLRLGYVAHSLVPLESLFGPVEEVLPVVGDGDPLDLPIQKEEDLGQVAQHGFVRRQSAEINENVTVGE